MNIELYPDEQIKQITNYPNYYVTTYGRVWSTLQGGHWLKPTTNRSGYQARQYVSLGRGNKMYIHRLVAEAFIPNPDNLPEVDHIDTNSMNNHVSNLRWVTRNNNMNNPKTVEHIKQNTGYLCEIEEIATGKKFLGYQTVAEYFGVCKGTILNHTKNRVANPRWRLTGQRVRPPEKNFKAP